MPTASSPVHRPFRALLPALAALLLILGSLSAGPARCPEDAQPDEISAEETYGKSPGEILAMGQGAWFEYYTEHAGFSTVATAMASAIYADAARERNTGLAPGYYSEALRQLAYDFGERALSIGPALSGGGSIWISIGAAMPADAEDLTYALRGGVLPPAPAMSTGQVQRRIATLEAQINALAADPQSSAWFDPDSSLDELRALRADFRAICALAAELPRADSDRVLYFCDYWLSAVTEFGEGS
ncbi:hypothetical protein IT575_15205 [bacterium]|nr:hypothetical protein [bacterium]